MLESDNIGKIPKERIQQLEEQLNGSAFRHGTSAFRYGLIPSGYSDHLPIVLTVNEKFSAISWNLLADDHLYNNFMNISGSQLIADLLDQHFPEGTPYQGNLYHLFAELSQYLYTNLNNNQIIIDQNALDGFVSLKNWPSRLARSRDPKKLGDKQKAIESARAHLVALILDNKQAFHNEIICAINHGLEMIYHIKNEAHGVLRFDNRFKQIKEDASLCQQLMAQDILCLQECSSPQAIASLFTGSGKPYQMITHRIHDKTNDHCVIFFCPDKFSLVGEPVCGDLQGKKPYILAKLRNNKTQEVMIVGSIHHPGGKHFMIPTLLAEAVKLKNAAPPAHSFFLLGDYNNTQSFYDKQRQDYESEDDAMLQYYLHYPRSGTLAGSDFGNGNQSIDAVLSNLDSSNQQVALLTGLAHAAPAETPFSVIFQYQPSRQYGAAPEFFQSVQRAVSPEESNCARNAFLVSQKTLSPRNKIM